MIKCVRSISICLIWVVSMIDVQAQSRWPKNLEDFDDNPFHFGFWCQVIVLTLILNTS